MPAPNVAAALSPVRTMAPWNSVIMTTAALEARRAAGPFREALTRRRMWGNTADPRTMVTHSETRSSLPVAVFPYSRPGA